jgi:hypothetical protein
VSDERISADEALERGYRWIRCGWNHKLNCAIYAPIALMRPFCTKPILAADLELAKWAMEDDPPAGDIPMVPMLASKAGR